MAPVWSPDGQPDRVRDDPQGPGGHLRACRQRRGIRGAALQESGRVHESLRLVVGRPVPDLRDFRSQGRDAVRAAARRRSRSQARRDLPQRPASVRAAILARRAFPVLHRRSIRRIGRKCSSGRVDPAATGRALADFGRQLQHRRSGGATARKLYYLARDQSIMVAEVSTSPSFSFSKPKVLFRQQSAVPERMAYVSADGERFLAACRRRAGRSFSKSPSSIDWDRSCRKSASRACTASRPSRRTRGVCSSRRTICRPDRRTCWTIELASGKTYAAHQRYAAESAAAVVARRQVHLLPVVPERRLADLTAGPRTAAAARNWCSATRPEPVVGVD